MALNHSPKKRAYNKKAASATKTTPATAEQKAAKIDVLEIYKPLFQPKRYKIFFGGRGGTKSWGFAQALLLIASAKRTRILCTRELQGSIKESVHKLLADTIDRMGLGAFFKVGASNIMGINGSQFIFEGLKNNTTKIKSMEGIDIVWAEEAEAISEFSWDLLIPTIRAKGSEIWISFNPFDELDETYQRYVAPYIDTVLEDGFYEDDDTYCTKVSFLDNPYFPPELKMEMEKCKKKNYYKYLHIWEGFPNLDFEDSIIKPMWFDAAIDAHKKLNFKAAGARIEAHDPADGGADNQAAIFRHGVVVQDIEELEGTSLEVGCDQIYKKTTQNKAQILIYDVGGLGVGARIKYEHLDPLNKMDKQSFNGSSTPLNPMLTYQDDLFNKDVFRNRRSQGYILLADRFEAVFRAVEYGEYLNPDDLISISSQCEHIDKLKGELTKIRKSRAAGRSLIQIETKKEMRKRKVKSPNLADALMMSFNTEEPASSKVTPTIIYRQQW